MQRFAKVKDVLDNEMRKTIYDYIVAHPHCRMIDIKRDTQSLSGNITYHLTVLTNLGYVKKTKIGKRPVYVAIR